MNKSIKTPNALINQKSVYLLQHAYNPVQWYPWTDDIFVLAYNQHKPILLSIGYSACHWCHVMEKESFEDENIASIMNEHFINVKVDREERPDIDSIYIEAIQTMTGSAGWPLHIFLLPDGKPFYGGTYFPPTPTNNRPSWKQVLESIILEFNKKNNKIQLQAANISNYLKKLNEYVIVKTDNNLPIHFSTETLHNIFLNSTKFEDKKWGGFSNPPKFPQFYAIILLYRYFYFYQNNIALNYANLTLHAMLNGGIYDQIEGGISRYSTDEAWLVPHFEKMLYDNALLIITLVEAYQITQHKPFLNKLKQTYQFVENKLSNPAGGFYTALDADAAGQEGLTYIWSFTELKSILTAQEFKLCTTFFNIKEEGNWENNIIFCCEEDMLQYAIKNNLNYDLFKIEIELLTNKILKIRNQRVQPITDTKIILNWNALMLFAYIQYYKLLGDDKIKDQILNHFTYLQRVFCNFNEALLYHHINNEKDKIHGFLDDYAFFIQVCIGMHQITANIEYLLEAKKYTAYVLKYFNDENSYLFYLNDIQFNQLIVAKKEIYDNPIPSGNAVMANNLVYLSIVFKIEEWKERAFKMIHYCANLIEKYPTSFNYWANNFLLNTSGLVEITITGDITDDEIKKINKKFNPSIILLFIKEKSKFFPLFTDIDYSKTRYHICKN
ncbi:MAG: thioredoxin domain-containing protein, partial [Sediminibacterium sp.]|nr:thioredoxin domain-containing protein [Sediminibacterium sp.]